MKITTKSLWAISFLIALMMASMVIVSAQEEATNSAEGEDPIKEAIKQQVNQRIDQILNKPVAVFGVITGVTDTNITVVDTRDETDEYTVVTSSLTEYQNSRGSSVDRKELALEDTVLIKGVQTNTNDRIEAEEVQIIKDYELSENSTQLGTVEATDTNEITINGSLGQQTITLTRSHSVLLFDDLSSEVELDELVDGDTVLLVGYKDDDDEFVGQVVIVLQQFEKEYEQQEDAPVQDDEDTSNVDEGVSEEG